MKNNLGVYLNFWGLEYIMNKLNNGIIFPKEKFDLSCLEINYERFYDRPLEDKNININNKKIDYNHGRPNIRSDMVSYKDYRYRKK